MLLGFHGRFFKLHVNVPVNAGRVITMGFGVDPDEINQFAITSKELDVRGSRLQNRKFQTVIDMVNKWKSKFEQ